MRRPYAGKSRWTICCVVAIACLVGGGGGNELELHKHDYSTNLWWQLMNRTEGNAANCYVCVQKPYAKHNPGLRPGNLTENEQMCLYVSSTRPRLSVPAPRGCRWCKKDYSVHLRAGDAAKGLFGSMNCSPTAEVLPYPPFQQTARRMPEIVSLAGAKPGSLRNCVYNNGYVSLGMLPLNLCNKVYTYCEPTPDFIDCTACRGQKTTPGCRVWKDNPDCDNLFQERRFNITPRTTTLCSAIVPGNYGSRMMTNWYFLCGNRAFKALPKYWGGLCALVAPDGTHGLHSSTGLHFSTGTHGSRFFDFLFWLITGPWWTVLLKLVTPILAVVILFCLLTGYTIPCCRNMMLKTIDTAVISYQLVQVTYDK